MDLQNAVRDQIPFETDFLWAQLNPYRAIGLLVRGLIGTDTQIAGLPCSPTTPASLSVVVGPGEIYKFEPFLSDDIGRLLGTGGIEADTNPDHFIMKQGLLLDSQTFAITPPATSGHSQKFLIQATFQEVDDPPEPTQFYNTQSPSAPITQDLSRARRDKCVLGLKAGTSAPTGSETAPAADAGYVPVWVITVASNASSITAPNIAQAAGAPLIEVGGGSPGGGLPPWTGVNTTYTAAPGDRLLPNMGGGTFTITLPPAPSAGAEVWIKGSFASTNLTIGRNGQTINGAASDLILDKNNITTILVFDGSTWRV